MLKAQINYGLTANRRGRKIALAVAAVVLILAIFVHLYTSQAVLRIYDWKTNEIYVEVTAKEGDELFFGWVHSLEKIPWNEYYHIADNRTLVLDKISFPAFGAGIPENKGNKCYVKDGLIYMDEIGQVFDEFSWLNSHFAVRDIKLNGVFITCGDMLPEHTRLRLVIERRFLHV